MKLKPIQWTPQFDGPRTRHQRAHDGDYGHVAGVMLFFIYHTSDPHTKGWRSWDKSGKQPCPENARVRYRDHWNVWFYFGAGRGTQISRALKSRAHAKRAARRALAAIIRKMLHP